MGYLATVIKPSVGGITVDFARYGAYIFPYVWHNIAYFADFGSIFLAIIIITNITNEYSFRTIKQNLIDGLTKREFLLSKLLLSLIFAILSTVLVCLACLILGLYYTDNPTAIFTGAEFVLGYFLKLSVFFSFCTFLAFWIRKSGFAFLLVILWKFAENILFGIEKINAMDASFYWSSLLPANATAELLPFPKVSLQNFISGKPIFMSSEFNFGYCIIAVAYTAIFIFLSYRLLKNRDL
jgi:ABC-type transport system involved in multi-copper enzyme maturation permease subunit